MNYSDLSLWFSSKGRINRRPYFFAGLVAGGLAKAFELVQRLDNPLFTLAYAPLVFLALYVSIVLAIKRSHDRGRRGWFVLLFFVPFLNIWPMVELTFFKGTDGPNEYGEDPLQPAATEAPTA